MLETRQTRRFLAIRENRGARLVTLSRRPASEIAAQVRLRAGTRLSSPALIADGNHARVDGFVYLAVDASAALVALGLQVGDLIIGLLITVVILRITWESWRTISAADPGQMIEPHHH